MKKSRWSRPASRLVPHRLSKRWRPIRSRRGVSSLRSWNSRTVKTDRVSCSSWARRGAAAANAPCVLLLEDLDAMAARRSLPGEGKAAQEGQLTEQVQGMIELCSILDGVREFPKGVFFVATSNRPDRLDDALVRPGRIDLRLELPGE